MQSVTGASLLLTERATTCGRAERNRQPERPSLVVARQRWFDQDQVAQLLEVHRVLSVDAGVAGPERNLAAPRVDQPPMLEVGFATRGRVPRWWPLSTPSVLGMAQTPGAVVSHGLRQGTPRGSKCLVFRVAMVISADSATAAMRASSNGACSGTR
jgi:hypothetical protein